MGELLVKGTVKQGIVPSSGTGVPVLSQVNAMGSRTSLRREKTEKRHFQIRREIPYYKTPSPVCVVIIRSDWLIEIRLSQQRTVTFLIMDQGQLVNRFVTIYNGKRVNPQIFIEGERD
jgi:hypothetical protein